MIKRLFKINWAVASALAILVSACAIANIGGLRLSPDVERSFEEMQVVINYRYWYLYLENSPYAVLGLDPEYRIQDIWWTEVQPGSETFQKVVELVRRFPVPSSRTFGAYILDADKQQIGVWYSSMSAGITVDPATKVVSIATGAPWMGNGGKKNSRD